MCNLNKLGNCSTCPVQIYSKASNLYFAFRPTSLLCRVFWFTSCFFSLTNEVSACGLQVYSPFFSFFFILTVSGIIQRSHKNETSQELNYQVNFPWPE